MKIFLALLGLVCLASCSSPTLKARSFYTSRKDLASYVLDTPDPEKTTTGLGQVIWVRWFCPHLDEGTVIDATLRFKDGSERQALYPIDNRYGWIMVEISPKERSEKGDLISYYMVLRHDETVFASTKHKLWVEKVEIKEN